MVNVLKRIANETSEAQFKTKERDEFISFHTLFIRINLRI